MRRGEALYTALEHEAMHQETLLYMWHRLPHEQKSGRSTTALRTKGRAGLGRADLGQRIPAGAATLGADRDEIPFGWDNEFDAHTCRVPAFDIDVHSVTNARLPRVRRGRRHADRRRSGVDEGWEWIQARAMFEHPAFWLPGPSTGPHAR